MDADGDCRDPVFFPQKAMPDKMYKSKFSQSSLGSLFKRLKTVDLIILFEVKVEYLLLSIILCYKNNSDS